jgi:anti-sigma regulatory factor (Ser/Thr protein kinase)
MNGDFEVRIPALARHVGLVRGFFGVLASECAAIRLAPREVSEVQLALQEACVNAIRHGGGAGPDGEIRVRFRAGGDRLTIEIRDRGPGFDPEAVPEPCAEALQEGGYGVFIMKESMDGVEARREEGDFVLALTRLYRKDEQTRVGAAER